MGPLLDQDEEEALSPSSSLEGKAPASPPLSFSSYASSLSPYQTLSSSPPPSPPPAHFSSFLGTKAGVDSLPWLSAGGLLDTPIRADDGKGEGDWSLICEGREVLLLNCFQTISTYFKKMFLFFFDRFIGSRWQGRLKYLSLYHIIIFIQGDTLNYIP